MTAPTTIPRIEELPDPLPDGTYVIIDVLRFSSTACHLIANNATAIHPFSDKEKARRFKGSNENVLLAGEEDCQDIPGFDFNNSPAEIARHDFRGKTIGALTTNGTRAVELLEEHEAVIGSTINARAVAERLKGDENTFLLACGHDGAIADEDLVGAKLIERYMTNDPPSESEKEEYGQQIRESPHAQTVRETGHQDDLEAVLRFDSLDTVPLVRDGVIRPGQEDT